jgi:acetolactate synthase-1/2/3 large subunit
VAPRELSTAQALIERLATHGVDRVFGIPGTHNLELYRHLTGAYQIEHAAPRHEQGAGFAADGYARASGRVAVCMVTTGPGALNTATAIATAYADSVPMIVVAIGPPSHVDGRDTGALHESKDQFGALSAVSGHSARIQTAAQAQAEVDAAIRSFALERPRPVYWEIPVDRLQVRGTITDAPIETADPHYPGGQELAAAAHELRHAATCAIVLGGGAIDAGPAATALAKCLDAPVVTTVNGKGTVADDDPLSLGASIRLKSAQLFLRECDVVLAVGTELAESDLWHSPPIDLTGKLIRVDIDRAQLDKNAKADIRLLGDARVTLERLLALLSDHRPAGTASTRVATVRKAVEADAIRDGAEFQKVMVALQAALSADAIVVNDSARICYYGAAHFLASHGSRRFLYPTGYATLGYALPAAVGAKLALPDRDVLSVMGDGGLLFSIAELSTAVQHGLPIPVLVHNDRGYGQIRAEMAHRNIPRLAVDFDPGRLIEIARGFGAEGTTIRDIDTLPTVIEQALTRDRPTLIELPSLEGTDIESGPLDTAVPRW